MATAIDPSIRPFIPGSVTYQQRDDKHLFFNTSVPDWVVVSANSAYILSLCNGDRSIREIAASIREAGGAIDESAVADFVAFARRRGILKAPEWTDSAAPQPAMPQLRSIYLKITNRCNLECSYCYAASGPAKVRGELTTEEWRDAIDQIAGLAAEGSKIHFTGGEPMIRSDLEELAGYAKARGFPTTLITNGGLLTPDNAPRLARLFESIQVSLDGDEDVHDKNRGRGSWKKARRAIRLLQEAEADYFVSATLTRDNKDTVRALVQEFGRRLRMGGILATGRAQGPRNSGLTNQEYVQATKASGAVGLFEDVHFLEASRGARRGHCGASTTTLSIDEFGTVFPCQILISKEMSAGNIRQTALGTILHGSAWDELRGATVDHDQTQGCASCHVRYICGGGCRAKVYYTGNTFKGPDGLCQMWRESIVNGLFKTAERPGSPAVFAPPQHAVSETVA
jgi:radical SAM protein with 4Fe4S-binding SPASM domain